MTLEALGWNQYFSRQLAALGDPRLSPERVARAEHGRYLLLGPRGARWAAEPGRLRHLAGDPSELPGVGDWVAVRPDGGVQQRLERSSSFLRKQAGRGTRAQLVAANIDSVLVLTDPAGDFNPRRLERYLVAVRQGGAEAVLVLNKLDLCADPEPHLARLRTLAGQSSVLALSVRDGIGLEALEPWVGPGRSVALAGSSGVGKSSLVNRLAGHELRSVSAIAADGRGRHTTTQRELVLLERGGVLIDTPGLRELEPWIEDQRLGFDELEELARACRFGDCRHRDEPGCAVLAAVAAGRLEAERLDHFHKLRRELEQQRARRDALQQQDRKRRWKQLSKEIRRHKRWRDHERQ